MGPLNVILSWKFWIPLSRLSYCVYIVHAYVFIIRTGSICRLYGKLHAINNICCCSLSGNRAAILQFGKCHTVESCGAVLFYFWKQRSQRWNAVSTLIHAPPPPTQIDLFKRTVLYSVSQGRTSRAEMVKLHRFLVISQVKDGENLKAVSPFILERVISSAAKADDSIRKLRNGTLWYRLIDIQWLNIMAISEITLTNTAHKRSKMDSYRFFNICEGVDTCYFFDCVSIEEICEELSPQHVTNVYRTSLPPSGTDRSLNILLRRLHGVALGQCDGRWESGIGNTSTRESVCEERVFSTFTKLLVVRTRVVGIAGQGTSSRSPLDNSGQPISRMVLKGGQPRCWEINYWGF
uniref:Uncharacterized protein n=1 Tax=Timema douglasi TaxID=61478 RepID=A0A7R8VSY3_TIMDO|nr:unnamed protein product [Timema douglasi]